MIFTKRQESPYLSRSVSKKGTELRGAQLSVGIGSYAQQQTVVARDREKFLEEGHGIHIVPVWLDHSFFFFLINF